MNKIAFIYPGQGSQKVGMGEDFYNNSPIAREIFDKANEVLDFNLLDICFKDNTDINDTRYTQPALVTTCIAISRHLINENIKPNITAGLSLGEYAAIAVADGIDDIQAIELVRKRGIYMNDAVENGVGTMVAVIGMDTKAIEEVTDSIKKVSIANYNCPGQIVITGEKKAVYKAMEKLKEKGARRLIELNVSGPFHSEFLKPAGEKLKANLEKIKWKKLSIPYVTNVDAGTICNISETTNLLTKQVSMPVRWEQSIRKMIDMGVDTFVEIGPGKTLTGFLRKIDRSVNAYNVSNLEDVKVLKEKLC